MLQMLLAWLLLFQGSFVVSAFTIPSCHPRQQHHHHSVTAEMSKKSTKLFTYQPIYEDAPVAQPKKPLYPKAGDIVRYYDLDGGKADGQVLVGKIAYIQKVLGSGSDSTSSSSSSSSWAVELTQLEDVGDGFYAEYSSRSLVRSSSKKTMRPLDQVAPIAASWVRTEAAFKVPRDGQGRILVRAEQYAVDSYPGPFVGENAINQDIVQADWEIYSALKGKLLREAALLSVAGTIVADLVKGPEDAAIYAAGAFAGVAYLFLLSVKTDTLGSVQSKMGSNISNLRFFMPFLVFVSVALYNKLILGDASPVSSSNNIFTTMSPEQFGAIVIGFLTYRLPLFANQITDLLKEGQGILPGSVGIAINLAKQQNVDDRLATTAGMGDLKTVLVVSGPQAAGRSELVQKLIAESDGRFVAPTVVDRVEQGAKFELLESRDELLTVDPTGRFGVTKEGILNASGATSSSSSVVVVDATVDTVKKLRKIPGIRLIGVWVGLDATEKFEARLKAQLESGELVLPEGEDEPSFLRAKIKDIVKDIEYGIVSVFLNSQF
ncbi:guanylate kinase-like protein [Fragilaria crotonensis]|nr:guanylate kinase-like protein [Fragilaria crotonensis]